MQDLLAGSELGGGGGGSRAKDNELAKVMFEGSQQHRRKLKLPEMNAAAEKIKEAVSAQRQMPFLQSFLSQLAAGATELRSGAHFFSSF